MKKITAKVFSFELTEEEKKIIDARVEKYHQNPELGSPWKDVYKIIVGNNEPSDTVNRITHGH